jgi:UDP:flavonoid glycosyltransferase YjiC (YdhE family)
MAAVVHHGGAGTTAASLKAGVPVIVTPFFGDQPFWAQQVHRLGVGPSHIPRRHLSVENLSKAIKQATSNEKMREKAVSLGKHIRSEDGVKKAVNIIANYWN